MPLKTDAIVLPASIIGPADLTRLKRELENLDEQLHQAQLRVKASGKTIEDTPIPKKLLQEIAKANNCDLQDRPQRQALLADVVTALKTSPTVTISFAVDPSDTFMAQIVSWFRTNTHPTVLVRVGLQPGITAGCRLQTPSKLYDFSLRRKFNEQRPLLVERLHGSGQVANETVS